MLVYLAVLMVEVLFLMMHLLESSVLSLSMRMDSLVVHDGA